MKSEEVQIYSIWENFQVDAKSDFDLNTCVYITIILRKARNNFRFHD